MKAPKSKRARRVLSDKNAARHIVAAARKGEPTPVKVRNATYVVRKAPTYRPKQSDTNGASDE